MTGECVTRCGSCGTTSSIPDARFCDTCGAQLATSVTHRSIGRGTVVLSVVLAAAILGAVVAAVATRESDDAPEPEQLAVGEVRPDRENTVESADGTVSVTIPGDAITGPGTLTIEPVTGRNGRHGWSIDLADAELVGPATVRFTGLNLKADEPPPLVTSSEQLHGKTRVVRNVTLDGDTVEVTTRHFSNWFLDPWSDLIGTVADWLVDRMDETASISGDRAPRCGGEQLVRDEGYKPSSDSGRRAYWCLGWENDNAVLKVVNARRYGVLSEHTPGLDITAREQGGAVDRLAEWFTPGPRQPGNHTALLAKGDAVEFRLDPTDLLVGVRLSPDPGGYLLTAMQFAVETLDMAFKLSGVTGTGAKIVAALAGTSCLTTFSDLATSDVATPQEAQEFFVDALNMAFSCAQVAGAQIDVGPVNRLLVEPILWAYNGISLAVAGLVATTDLIVDVLSPSDGYQIHIRHEQIVVTPPTGPANCGAALQAGGIDGLAEFVIDAINGDTLDDVECAVQPGTEDDIEAAQELVTPISDLTEPCAIGDIGGSGEALVCYAEGAHGERVWLWFNSGSAGESFQGISWYEPER